MKYKVIKAFPSTHRNWKVGEIISPIGFKGICEIASNWPEYFEEYTPILTTQDGVDLFEGDSYYFAWLKESANKQTIHTPYYVNKITKLTPETSFSKDAVFFKNLENLENYLVSIKPKPLFITEDGVDVFEDDSCWYVNENYFYNMLRSSKNISVKNLKLFSTKEKAEEYILMNKPCLSLNDVCNTVTWLNQSKIILKELVKSRI